MNDPGPDITADSINHTEPLFGGSCIVGFDGKRAVHNTTGLGGYSRYTIEALDLECPNVQKRVYAAGGPGLMDGKAVSPNTIIIGPESRKPASLWRVSGMGRQAAKDGCQVFHGLSNELPSDSWALPSVVTVHDVIWRRYPSDYKFIDRRIYDIKNGMSMRCADRIIAISECTARDIQEDFNVSADKIDIIYQGVDSRYRLSTDGEVASLRSKYKLPERYIAAVGTVQGRKNQLLAVKALRDLPKDVGIIIVGRRTDYARTIDEYARQYGLTNRITWLSGISFDELRAVYTGAFAASYPSRYEGFGLPVVEAIACGTPVIAATGSCLEEAGGPGAFYVNPDDDEQFAHYAKTLLDDSALREKMTATGAEYIKRFNTTQFAVKTMWSYARAIRNYEN